MVSILFTTIIIDFGRQFSPSLHFSHGLHYFPSSKLTLRHFRKMEEVLNGYVTNPNPTYSNPNRNPNRINKKIQKETTLENR
jgi:hypothetical protein